VEERVSDAVNALIDTYSNAVQSENENSLIYIVRTNKQGRTFRQRLGVVLEHITSVANLGRCINVGLQGVSASHKGRQNRWHRVLDNQMGHVVR
jgi:hypothetical protein